MRDPRPKAERSRFASRCRECPPGFVRSDAGCRWSLLGSGTPVIRTRPVRSFAAWPPHRPCEGRNSETIRVARHRRQTNVGDCFSRVGENEEPYNPVSRDCFDSSCFPFHPSNPPNLGMAATDREKLTRADGYGKLSPCWARESGLPTMVFRAQDFTAGRPEFVSTI